MRIERGTENIKGAERNEGFVLPELLAEPTSEKPSRIKGSGWVRTPDTRVQASSGGNESPVNHILSNLDRIRVSPARLIVGEIFPAMLVAAGYFIGVGSNPVGWIVGGGMVIAGLAWGIRMLLRVFYIK